jgi:hypothetical protein
MGVFAIPLAARPSVAAVAKKIRLYSELIASPPEPRLL